MRLDFGRCVTIFSATSVNCSARRIIRSTLRFPGNDHSGTLCSPRPRSGSGCASKYARDVPVELVVLERVPAARAHVVVRGSPRLRGRAGDRQDRVHDDVDRDDVDDALGDAGELGDLAQAVRPDDRVGHLEAVDPPGRRVEQRALDDRRPHDRQRQLLQVRELLHRSLAHRLRERVDVGPAERARARPAVARQTLRHPVLAALLGVFGHRRRTGARVLLRRLVHEVVEHLGTAGLRLDVAPRLERQLALGPPVHLVLEGVLGDDALRDAGDVRGRDVHQARTRAAVDHAAVQVHRAEQVRLEPLVDRRVERHGRGGVDRDVDVARELRHAPREVAVDDRRPARPGSRAARRRRCGRAARRTPACGSRYSTRSRDVEPVWERTNRTIRPSGTSPSSRSKMTCPRNPVTPVSRIVLPERRLDDRGRRSVGGVLYHAADYGLSTRW